MIRKKFLIFNIALFLSVVCPSFQALALTASEAISKVQSKLESAKTIKADFSMAINGSTVTGKIYSKGKKFAIITSPVSNWYNGKDLYTYNASQGETTIFSPTESELAEINPLLYISCADDYKVLGSKNIDDNTVMLVPKEKNSSIKNVKIELNSTTYLPKKIGIKTSSGDNIDIKISNIKLNETIEDSTFEYPKTKYSNVPVTDMR